ILVISAIAQRSLGALGLVATGAASGLVDVDAITLAAARQSIDGETTTTVAAVAITAAVVSNTVVKSGIAWFGGGRAFGIDIVKVLGASAVLAIIAAVVRL